MSLSRDAKLSIATAPRKTSKQWTPGTVTWGEILEWLPNPADHKECGGYVLGRIKRRGPRNAETILSRSAIVLDADRADEDFLVRIDLTFPYAAAIHSTYQHLHGTEGHRYRLIIPTDREMKPEEYRPAAQQLMAELGIEYFDRTSDEYARFMYKPSAAAPEKYEHLAIDGDPISVDGLLADTLIPESVLKTKRDPFSLVGVAGDFNRAYTDLAELVEAYDLPYEHEGSNRWHLVGASSVAGMGEISDGLWYSHHANDPVHGHAQTAFDLVRLHRFGHLDEGVGDNVPLNRLPSYKAMTDLATEDPKVKEAYFASLDADFETEEATDVDASPDDDDDSGDWRSRLTVNRQGKTNDDSHNWGLIRANDEVFALLTMNEMTFGIETTGDLPWRKRDEPSPTFSRTDRTELRVRIEKRYGFRPERSYLDDLINAHAAKNSYHPIRDYLRDLEWDGKPRIETCLPGVRPTRYSRFVARRVMIAAVARIMEPGCKWDHTLVLYGKEGLGKSYWVHRISKGYSSALGRLGDKDTLLAMQRSWIMLSDEGHSIQGSSSDARKEFLTRTEDTFRRPYDSEAQTIKRHSVIFATTNSRNFLSREEGNRRFLIVHVEDRVDFASLSDDYIDQLWAEAMTAYIDGEQWHLTEEEAALAAAEREAYTLDDPRFGIVEEYLETLVPKSWEAKSPEERSWWYRSRGEDTMEKGTEPINRVSLPQILVEGLGRRIGEWRDDDLRAISDIMDRMDGWVEAPEKEDVPKYGPQKVWLRRNTS